MKTFMFVSSFLLVVVAAALLYTASHSRQQAGITIAEYVPEPAMTSDIKAALFRSFGQDASHIHVKAQKNAVSLSGIVSERSTRELAEEVVKSVDGVVVVHNFLDLDSSDAAIPGQLLIHAERAARDAVIETGVKTKLTSDIGTEAIAVSVEACDGVVSLRGDLPDEQLHAEAIHTAESVAGVERVIDLIEVAA